MDLDTWTLYLVGSEMAPNWMRQMNLSIKNAPEDVVRRLRSRAERNHRSLQGELMAIIEAAVREDEYLTPMAALAEARRLGLGGEEGESAAMVREMRDGRHGR